MQRTGMPPGPILREPAAALRELGIDDPHVFELERLTLSADLTG